MTLTKTEPTAAHQPATPLHTERHHRGVAKQTQVSYQYSAHYPALEKWEQQKCFLIPPHLLMRFECRQPDQQRRSDHTVHYTVSPPLCRRRRVRGFQNRFLKKWYHIIKLGCNYICFCTLFICLLLSSLPILTFFLFVTINYQLMMSHHDQAQLIL